LSISLTHKVGPDCRIAGVLIDGAPAPTAELDTYAPAVEWNHQSVLASVLPDGEHTVIIEVTGRRNGRSSNG